MKIKKEVDCTYSLYSPFNDNLHNQHLKRLRPEA